jgi:hypothetical protein
MDGTQDLEARLARSERAIRNLRAALLGLIVLSAGALFAAARGSSPAGPSGTLQLSELVIVDSTGTPRVRLGGHLPDAVINGKPVPRGQDASGVLLYDATGVERGGYVTFAPSGNVALTLDTRERQVALFAADPEEGAVARLWSTDGANWVQLRADDSGARFSSGRDGSVVFQQPALLEEESAAFCRAFNDEVAGLDRRPAREELLSACTRQMPADVCERCLGVLE